VALLSGIALSPELQDRYGRHLKNCDPVSVLRVRTSRSLASLPSPAPHALDPLAPYCYALSSWHLICLPGWHPTAPTIAGTSTAEWLSSPGDSPRPPPAPAIYSTVANLALGYAVSWYSTTSLAHAKVRSVAAPRLLPCWDIACPCSLLVWGSIYVSFKVEQ